MLPSELSRQWVISSLCHDTFSDPLPELSLRGPELLAIAADHQGRLPFFLLLILLLRGHWLLRPSLGLSAAPRRHNSIFGFKAAVEMARVSHADLADNFLDAEKTVFQQPFRLVQPNLSQKTLGRRAHVILE